MSDEPNGGVDATEERFPITCGNCRYLLTGLGDRGVCPECGVAFEPRERLFELHGPEAFVPGGDPAQRSSSPVALFLNVVGVLSLLPLLGVVWWMIFARIQIIPLLITWWVLISVVEAIYAMVRPRRR